MNKTYQRYIRSRMWRHLRERALERDGHACQECGSSESLHVHHLTYERVYEELLEDLQVLCASCHSKKHGVKGPKRRVHRMGTCITCRTPTDQAQYPWGWGWYCSRECRQKQALSSERVWLIPQRLQVSPPLKRKTY